MRAVIHKAELPAEGRIIAISDVHANLPYLKGLLAKLSLRSEDTLGSRPLSMLLIMLMANTSRFVAVMQNPTLTRRWTTWSTPAGCPSSSASA